MASTSTLSNAPSSAPAPAPDAPERVSIDPELLKDPQAIDVLTRYFDLKKQQPDWIRKLVDADKATRLLRISKAFVVYTRSSGLDTDKPEEAFAEWIGAFFSSVENVESMKKIIQTLPLFRDITPEELEVG
jgi:hypothetical protein